MKKQIVWMIVLALVLISLAGCAEKTSPARVESENLLQGEWTYECDVLHFNRYTWTSTLTFEHAEMVVKATFDDWTRFETPLPFRIYSPEPGYEFDWLYVEEDGSFNAELVYFETSATMENYPGGYLAFKQELEEMNIDWVTMYHKVKVEFYRMYLAQISANPGECTPTDKGQKV